ncbi:hypothetical protein [Shewanella sp. SR44-3]|uniref:Y-family DNA polymerase n=1 Tax=unclassified Shewanella TaxID=196818 RepID=UPI0015F7C338|nr:hypothetical protein [Shewanella sp. SR44-3]MBB1270314.1 hypothetical protein [Shewanella sp. SR44-3]
MFALVDANSFYCSAEQVFRPDWRGKPIVVLSNNDGCIIAGNRQAKETGIGKYLLLSSQRIMREAWGMVCSSNNELYTDLLRKMMNIVDYFTFEQHVYSNDVYCHCYSWPLKY